MAKYEVTIARCGYVTVEANSEADAMEKVKTGVKADEVHWSDDWEATDATEE